jgi:hypothetical protein
LEKTVLKILFYTFLFCWSYSFASEADERLDALSIAFSANEQYIGLNSTIEFQSYFIVEFVSVNFNKDLNEFNNNLVFVPLALPFYASVMGSETTMYSYIFIPFALPLVIDRVLNTGLKLKLYKNNHIFIKQSFNLWNFNNLDYSYGLNAGLCISIKNMFLIKASYYETFYGTHIGNSIQIELNWNILGKAWDKNLF